MILGSPYNHWPLAFLHTLSHVSAVAMSALACTPHRAWTCYAVSKALFTFLSSRHAPSPTHAHMHAHIHTCTCIMHTETPVAKGIFFPALQGSLLRSCFNCLFTGCAWPTTARCFFLELTFSCENHIACLMIGQGHKSRQAGGTALVTVSDGDPLALAPLLVGL